MLIDFKVSNWMSFRDDTRLSMCSAEFNQFKERLPKVKKFQVEMLPISMTFGGNASGKSNFVSALQFAQEFVLKGTEPNGSIKRVPFLSDSSDSNKDTKFEFTLLIKELIYRYSFSVNNVNVTGEKLIVSDSKKEITNFHRTDKRYKNFNLLGKSNQKKKLDFLKYIQQGTRKNQLFLTNSVIQNEQLFSPVYDWFRNTLRIVTPSSWHLAAENLSADNPFLLFLNNIVPKLDIGISSVRVEEIPFELLPITEAKKLISIKKLVKKGQ